MIQSQVTRLYELLKDGRPHSTVNILKEVYGSEHLGIARISARIWDVQKKHGVKIRSWKDQDNPAIWWYQIISAVNKQHESIVNKLAESPQKKLLDNLYNQVIDNAKKSSQAALFTQPPKSTAKLWTS